MKAKIISLSLSIIFSCIVFAGHTYASEDVPPDHEHGTSSSATVSEDVDTATNQDNTASTDFYMYLPPDPTFEDIPMTGDFGIQTEFLIASTLGTAAVFLTVTYLALKVFRDNDTPKDKGKGEDITHET